MIRIAIGTMPPLLRSIVSSALEAQEGMAVVHPVASGPGSGRSAGDADVLIVCSDREPDERIALRQLASADSPGIVAIDSAGACATILRVTAERMPIAAAADLCAAVRLAARHRSRATN